MCTQVRNESMHGRNAIAADPAKAVTYGELKAQLAGLFADERDGLANAANTAAGLYHGLPDLNWAGFYLLRAGELVMGPFPGRGPCVRNRLGTGVWGTARPRPDAVVVPRWPAFP